MRSGHSIAAFIALLLSSGCIIVDDIPVTQSSIDFAVFAKSDENGDFSEQEMVDMVLRQLNSTGQLAGGGLMKPIWFDLRDAPVVEALEQASSEDFVGLVYFGNEEFGSEAWAAFDDLNICGIFPFSGRARGFSDAGQGEAYTFVPDSLDALRVGIEALSVRNITCANATYVLRERFDLLDAEAVELESYGSAQGIVLTVIDESEIDTTNLQVGECLFVERGAHASAVAGFSEIGARSVTAVFLDLKDNLEFLAAGVNPDPADGHYRARFVPGQPPAVALDRQRELLEGILNDTLTSDQEQAYDAVAILGLSVISAGLDEASLVCEKLPRIARNELNDASVLEREAWPEYLFDEAPDVRNGKEVNYQGLGGTYEYPVEGGVRPDQRYVTHSIQSLRQEVFVDQKVVFLRD